MDSTPFFVIKGFNTLPVYGTAVFFTAKARCKTGCFEIVSLIYHNHKKTTTTLFRGEGFIPKSPLRRGRNQGQRI
jgi:hypothetical protein